MKDIDSMMNEWAMHINRYCRILLDDAGTTANGSAWRKTTYTDPETGIMYDVEKFNGQTVKIERR